MPSTAYAQDRTGNQVFADVIGVRWGHTVFGGGALNAPTAAPSSVENECGIHTVLYKLCRVGGRDAWAELGGLPGWQKTLPRIGSR